MEIVTVPRESITCLMCRGSVQFNKNDQHQMHYNNHLKYHHGVYFHHDIYLSVNLLNGEFLQKIFDEFKTSGKLSDFTSRDEYLGEVVIDVEEGEGNGNENEKERCDIETQSKALSRVEPSGDLHEHMKRKSIPKDIPSINNKIELKEDSANKKNSSQRSASKMLEQFGELLVKKRVEKRESESVNRKTELRYVAADLRQEEGNQRNYNTEKIQAREEQTKSKSRKRKCEEDVLDNRRVTKSLNNNEKHLEQEQEDNVEELLEKSKDDEVCRTSKNSSQAPILGAVKAINLNLVNEDMPDHLKDICEQIDKIDPENKPKTNLVDTVDSFTQSLSSTQHPLLSSKKPLASPKTVIPCHKCDFKTTKNIALKKHIDQAHKVLDNQFPCKECGEGFKTDSDRNTHYNEQHSLKPESKDDMIAALTGAIKGVSRAATPTLDEAGDTSFEEQDCEPEPSSENDTDPRQAKTFEEIKKTSEYFQSFPKQLRKGYESDKLRYLEIDSILPEGWFYRVVGSRAGGRCDKEFLSPDCVIFRSRKAAIEYAKCMNIYSNEVICKLNESK